MMNFANNIFKEINKKLFIFILFNFTSNLLVSTPGLQLLENNFEEIKSMNNSSKNYFFKTDMKNDDDKCINIFNNKYLNSDDKLSFNQLFPKFDEKKLEKNYYKKNKKEIDKLLKDEEIKNMTSIQKSKEKYKELIKNIDNLHIQFSIIKNTVEGLAQGIEYNKHNKEKNKKTPQEIINNVKSNIEKYIKNNNNKNENIKNFQNIFFKDIENFMKDQIQNNSMSKLIECLNNEILNNFIINEFKTVILNEKKYNLKILQLITNEKRINDIRKNFKCENKKDNKRNEDIIDNIQAIIEEQKNFETKKNNISEIFSQNATITEIQILQNNVYKSFDKIKDDYYYKYISVNDDFTQLYTLINEMLFLDDQEINYFRQNPKEIFKKLGKTIVNFCGEDKEEEKECRNHISKMLIMVQNINMEDKKIWRDIVLRQKKLSTNLKTAMEQNMPENQRLKLEKQERNIIENLYAKLSNNKKNFFILHSNRRDKYINDPQLVNLLTPEFFSLKDIENHEEKFFYNSIGIVENKQYKDFSNFLLNIKKKKFEKISNEMLVDVDKKIDSLTKILNSEDKQINLTDSELEKNNFQLYQDNIGELDGENLIKLKEKIKQIAPNIDKNLKDLRKNKIKYITDEICFVLQEMLKSGTKSQVFPTLKILLDGIEKIFSIDNKKSNENNVQFRCEKILLQLNNNQLNKDSILNELKEKNKTIVLLKFANDLNIDKVNEFKEDKVNEFKKDKVNEFAKRKKEDYCPVEKLIGNYIFQISPQLNLLLDDMLLGNKFINNEFKDNLIFKQNKQFENTQENLKKIINNNGLKNERHNTSSITLKITDKEFIEISPDQNIKIVKNKKWYQKINPWTYLSNLTNKIFNRG